MAALQVGHHPFHRPLLRHPLPRRLPLLFPGKLESPLVASWIHVCLVASFSCMWCVKLHFKSNVFFWVFFYFLYLLICWCRTLFSFYSPFLLTAQRKGAFKRISFIKIVSWLFAILYNFFPLFYFTHNTHCSTQIFTKTVGNRTLNISSVTLTVLGRYSKRSAVEKTFYIYSLDFFTNPSYVSCCHSR